MLPGAGDIGVGPPLGGRDVVVLDMAPMGDGGKAWGFGGRDAVGERVPRGLVQPR